MALLPGSKVMLSDVNAKTRIDGQIELTTVVFIRVELLSLPPKVTTL